MIGLDGSLVRLRLCKILEKLWKRSGELVETLWTFWGKEGEMIRITNLCPMGHGPLNTA